MSINCYCGGGILVEEVKAIRQTYLDTINNLKEDNLYLESRLRDAESEILALENDVAYFNENPPGSAYETEM